MSASDKTEKATPKRREEARKKGQVARSTDLNGSVVLIAALGALAAFGPMIVDGLGESMRGLLAQIANPGQVSAAGLRPLLETAEDGSTNYDTQANWAYAKHLKGKLMLTHGTMDDNVPPSNTLLVVKALIEANKDFDLLMLPNARHGYGDYTPYVMRRRWDYFVSNLAGNTPPDEYRMHPPAD